MRFAKKIVIMCIIGCIILSTLFGVVWSASTLDSVRAGRQQVNIIVKHENGTQIDATDATDVAIDTTVIVEFDQLINESTVVGNITLEFQAKATLVPGQFSFETINNNSTVIFTPDEHLLKVTTYDFNINSWVRNETDWPIFPTGYTISFTTELFDNGTISGYILDVNNGTGIAGVNVTATGNNNVTWNYTDGDGYYEFSLYPATYRIDADGTEVHYSTSYIEGINVTEDVTLLHVNLTLEEMAQRVNVYVIKRQTSGLSPPDNWIEADGAIEVCTKPDIKIVFEEEMDYISVKGNLTLYVNQIAINGMLNSDDNITFYFDPAGDLNENTEYDLTITSGVLPLNTSHESPLWRDLSFEFTTRENPLKSVFPVDNAQDVPIDTEIEITFNIDINESTLKSSIRISSANGDVNSTLLYDNATGLATFTPDEVLEGDTVYTVHIADTLTDTDGTRVLPPDDFPNQYSWSFRTEATSGTLNITVADKSNIPLPNVKITVYLQDVEVDSGTTDIDGNVQIELLAGEYNVTATLNGYLDYTDPYIIIEAGRPKDRRITLASETGSVSGTVTDSEDNPLENVVVRAYLDDTVMGSATTAANGQYTISNLLPGDYNLTFSLDEYEETTAENVRISADSQIFENEQLDKAAAPPEPDDDDEDEIDWMMWIIIIIIILVILVLIAAVLTRKKPEGEEVEAIEEGYGAPSAAPTREYAAAPPPTTYRELVERGEAGEGPAKPRYYGRCPTCNHQIIGTDECFHCAIRATYEVQEPPMMMYYE